MRIRHAPVALAIAVVTFGLPCTVLAEPDVEDGWALVVEGSTQFPTFAGGGVRAETPWNLDLRVDAGFLPQGYGKVVNDLAQDLGGYDEATAFVIEESFEESFVLRVGGAWHPFGGGFYLGIGYAWLDLSGDVTNTEALLAAIPGAGALPAGFEGSVPIDTTVHMIQGELGYEWEIVSHLELRLALGISGTVGSRVDLGVPPGLPPILDTQARALERIGEPYLEGIIEDYLHTVTGTIGLGYRF